MWQIWLAISATILVICFIYVAGSILIYKRLKMIEGKLEDRLLYIQKLKEKVVFGKIPLRELYDEIEIYNLSVGQYNKRISTFLIKYIANKYGIESKENFLKM